MMKDNWFVLCAEFIISAFLIWCTIAIYKNLSVVSSDDIVFYIFGMIFASGAAFAFICDILYDIIEYYKNI